MADLPVYNEEDQRLAESNKMFTFTAELNPVAIVELPFVLFRNPSGSGKAIKVKRIVLANTHTATSWVKFVIYVAPTVLTTGTSLPIFCTHIGSGASSSMQAFTGPTISVLGSVAFRTACPAAISSGPTILPTDFDYIIEPGIDTLITAQADGNNRVANLNVVWVEV